MENPRNVVSSTLTDYGSTTSKKNSNYDDGDDESNIVSDTPVTGYQSLPYSSSTNLYRKSRRGVGGSFVVVSSRFAKMSVDTMPNSEMRQIVQRLEYFLSVLNQICIGFVTIYMSWLCLRTGLSGTALHAWLVTIGFSFLMAEAVMVHYSGNVLTFNYKRNTKTTLHWILQVIGGTCGITGVLIKCIQKGFLLQSTHGQLGFAAFILCLCSMLSGLSALYSMRFKKLVSPLLNKSVHNVLGIVAFVLALLAQYYGYQTGFFSRKAYVDFQILMRCLTLMSLVLTCIGPLKAAYHKARTIVKHFS